MEVYWIVRSFPNKIRFWTIFYLTLTSSYTETKEILDYQWIIFDDILRCSLEFFLEIFTGIYVHQCIESYYKGQFLVT